MSKEIFSLIISLSVSSDYKYTLSEPGIELTINVSPNSCRRCQHPFVSKFGSSGASTMLEPGIVQEAK